MSLAKLSAMKGLVSSSQTKRRFKKDLSPEMIGLPMGDFRHTMHVGRGGDVFGDTSFLSNFGGVREPESPDSTTSGTSFFTRKFKHVRKNSGPRLRGGSRDLTSPPPDVSPIIKNAISLPQLNMLDSPNGLQKEGLTSSFSCGGDVLYTYGYQSGCVTLPRLPFTDRAGPDGRSCRGSLPSSDSLTSLSLDLGPSLMTEMLDMFDNHSCLQTSNQSQAERDGEDQDEEVEEKEEEEEDFTPVQSPEIPCKSVCSRFSGSDFTHSQEHSPVSSPDLSESRSVKSFQTAAHVPSRYGASFTQRNRVSASTSEDDEEIKV